MRSLRIPAALFLMTAFAVGCTDQLPTAPSDSPAAAAASNDAPTAEPASINEPVFEASAAARSADRCINVSADVDLMLGPGVNIPPLGLTDGFGALPGPIDFGAFRGMMSSIVTASTGAVDRADHLSVAHYFEDEDDVSSFWTDDRAICAPSGKDPSTCRLSDKLNIVDGTGKFANASGFLHQAAFADFGAGTLTGRIHGRVCGDGI